MLSLCDGVSKILLNAGKPLCKREKICGPLVHGANLQDEHKVALGRAPRLPSSGWFNGCLWRQLQYYAAPACRWFLQCQPERPICLLHERIGSQRWLDRKSTRLNSSHLG